MQWMRHCRHRTTYKGSFFPRSCPDSLQNRCRPTQRWCTNLFPGTCARWLRTVWKRLQQSWTEKKWVGEVIFWNEIHRQWKKNFLGFQVVSLSGTFTNDVKAPSPTTSKQNLMQMTDFTFAQAISVVLENYTLHRWLIFVSFVKRSILLKKYCNFTNFRYVKILVPSDRGTFSFV